MKEFRSHYLLLSLIFLLCLKSTWAQVPVIDVEQEQQFEEAKLFLLSFKNDSALVILNKLVDELSAAKQLDTPFGVRVQYRQAEALEKDNKDEEAIQKLLHAVEASEELEQWDVLTNAHLSLARLYEKINRPESCLINLRLAESIINLNQVDSLYPRFAIRISSYHRIFRDVDSSIYYAREVLRTAPKYNLMEENAVGHLLLGLLLGNSSLEEAIEHFTSAGKTWKISEDFTGYGYTQNNLSRLYYRDGKFKEALRYNDSTLVAAAKSLEIGHDDYALYYTAYKHRANIFNALKRRDSAWHYINKGYELELREVHKENHEKVIEIDAAYKDEKRTRTISEQQKLIKYEKERRYSLVAIILLMLLSAIVLSYYYVKLRRANQKTRAQALTIIKNNKDMSHSLKRQIILQSEVHHRVKNNLQIIISLLELQMEEVDDPKAQENLRAMANRIYSMAAIHEILYQQGDVAQVSLFDYAENLCMHFSNFSVEEKKPEFNINIKDQYFNLETSMPLGIILTELLTNSLKYARVAGKKLEIAIDLIKQDEGYCLTYKDNGPGFSEGKLIERDKGLGTYLLNSMSRQLSGHMESKNDEGASFSIFFKEKK